MSLDPASVAALDGSGYVVLEALTPGTLRSASTHARPHTFVCIDGKTYWVKGNAQQGLVAELIAGRLAAMVGAGPPARIVRVTPAVLPATGEAAHLEGIVVGSEDQPGTVNARDLEPFVRNGTFQPGAVDPAARRVW